MCARFQLTTFSRLVPHWQWGWLLVVLDPLAFFVEGMRQLLGPVLRKTLILDENLSWPVYSTQLNPVLIWFFKTTRLQPSIKKSFTGILLFETTVFLSFVGAPDTNANADTNGAVTFGENFLRCTRRSNLNTPVLLFILLVSCVTPHAITRL